MAVEHYNIGSNVVEQNPAPMLAIVGGAAAAVQTALGWAQSAIDGAVASPVAEATGVGVEVAKGVAPAVETAGGGMFETVLQAAGDVAKTVAPALSIAGTVLAHRQSHKQAAVLQVNVTALSQKVGENHNNTMGLLQESVRQGEQAVEGTEQLKKKVDDLKSEVKELIKSEMKDLKSVMEMGSSKRKVAGPQDGPKSKKPRTAEPEKSQQCAPDNTVVAPALAFMDNPSKETAETFALAMHVRTTRNEHSWYKCAREKGPEVLWRRMEAQNYDPEHFFSMLRQFEVPPTRTDRPKWLKQEWFKEGLVFKTASQILQEQSADQTKGEHGWIIPCNSASLLPSIGSRCQERPEWYNSPGSDCVNAKGTQDGSTCGLHAVNHILASAGQQTVIRKAAFEATAMQAKIGDKPENLVDRNGGSNYDVAVLNVNLGEAGLRTWPMAPGDLQGDTPDTARLLRPFVEHYDDGKQYKVVGYILRTPQAGGHWIAVLPPTTIGLETTGACAGVLCDSLVSSPFQLSEPEMESLLTMCALDGSSRQSRDAFAAHAEWACFLVTDDGSDLCTDAGLSGIGRNGVPEVSSD